MAKAKTKAAHVARLDADKLAEPKPVTEIGRIVSDIAILTSLHNSVQHAADALHDAADSDRRMLGLHMKDLADEAWRRRELLINSLSAYEAETLDDVAGLLVFLEDQLETVWGNIRLPEDKRLERQIDAVEEMIRTATRAMVKLANVPRAIVKSYHCGTNSKPWYLRVDKARQEMERHKLEDEDDE